MSDEENPQPPLVHNKPCSLAQQQKVLTEGEDDIIASQESEISATG